MTKRILFVLAFLFFASMFFLTLFAESIHNAFLPEVTVSRSEKKLFPFEYVDENGNLQSGYSENIAVSSEMLENNIYIIYSAEKNGTRRFFVRLTPVQTGKERDGYTEIVSGIMFSDQIVINTTKELFDGCEVIVK